MSHNFDPGPVFSPFQELVADYPGTDVYPAADFRVEWGPIFHRGRLDGTARVLVIGQDPAASEDITRRILVGEAGHRTQGLLAKLGIDRSYVMINTYLYSVYGQRSSDDNQQDEDIAAYRHRWLDAIAATSPLEAVIALGGAADAAWRTWKKATSSPAKDLPFAHVTHPTQPESSSHNDPVKRAAATKTMLKNWNGALDHLHPAVQHPDTPRPAGALRRHMGARRPGRHPGGRPARRRARLDAQHRSVGEAHGRDGGGQAEDRDDHDPRLSYGPR
ncbi:MAG TPA: uracil-DNA glycosylase family protein [Baekduia sp.]|nr:uracil-DNA glycosylase family protein [Baekduia sp.]